ncbi:MAG: hypothetical protein HOV81_22160 [Kofleriaceae bacterium]|nr:hypothetical protein [Kofleriaceae bacterium]
MSFDLDDDLLRAAAELYLRRIELCQLFASVTRIDALQHWSSSRRSALGHAEQVAEWSWTHAAFGFDVAHHGDGRRTWIEIDVDGTLDGFSLTAIDVFVRHSSAPWGVYPRLAHPLLASILVPLVESLASRALVERTGERYRVTGAGRAYLAREPHQLR